VEPNLMRTLLTQPPLIYGHFILAQRKAY